MSQKQLNHKEVKNKTHNYKLSIVCDGIRSPENAGMIFRIAEAFGVMEIIFPHHAPELNNTKLKKAARSTQKLVKSIFVNSISKYILDKKSQDFSILGVEVTNSSIPIQNYKFDPKKHIVLILGDERYGISDEVLKLTDECIEIEMFGKNSSMNVSTALSIVLYELTRNA